MQSKVITPNFLIISTLILIAVISRFLPHPPNFTAIGAIALFGAAHFQNKAIGFSIPLLAMLFSDILLGIHSHIIAVYVSFALIAGIGFILKKNLKTKNLFIASLISSIVFFLITNFSVWLANPLYPQSIIGLIECYIIALPFGLNTLLGDFFFNASLFGGFYLVKKNIPSLSISK